MRVCCLFCFCLFFFFFFQAEDGIRDFCLSRGLGDCIRDSFPPAARQALSDSRSEGASGEVVGGFGSFLREQLNVRSVAPREGDDADAILSRAEAALREGQLQAALTEVAALPELAAAPLAGWVNQAQARADALTAANEISSSLNDN